MDYSHILTTITYQESGVLIEVKWETHPNNPNQTLISPAFLCEIYTNPTVKMQGSFLSYCNIDMKIIGWDGEYHALICERQ